MEEPLPIDLIQYLPEVLRAHGGQGLAHLLGKDVELAEGAPTADPLLAIVRHFEETSVRRTEQILLDAPSEFDADYATYAPGWPAADFLGLLALWVAFDADTASYGEPNHADVKLRFLVKNAASIHAARGTPRGLRYILETLCEVEIDLIEWTWPRGFAIGVSSSTGLDTFLTEHPAHANCLTLVWKTPLPDDLPEGSHWLETSFGGETEGRRVLSLIQTEAEAERTARAPTGGLLPTKLKQIRRLLSSEAPAHVHAYLALETPGEPHLEGAVFIVGLERAATVERVWLESTPHPQES